MAGPGPVRGFAAGGPDRLFRRLRPGGGCQPHSHPRRDGERIRHPAAEEEDAVQETAAPDETADAGLILAFTLLDADGAPLSDASLQLTIGEDQADYPAEEDGTLTVSGLPRTGTAELVLTDASGAELGTLELQLSEGSVTDAVDNGDGTASLTVLTESEEAAITLAMGDGGTLTCSLTAAEPSAS